MCNAGQNSVAVLLELVCIDQLAVGLRNPWYHGCVMKSDEGLENDLKHPVDYSLE